MTARSSLQQYLTLLQDIFVPNELYDEVEDIPVEDLFEKGYDTILLDVDNTIMAYSERKISLQKYQWVQRLKGTGFRVFIVSNNSGKRRLRRLSKEIDCEGIYFAMKPLVFNVVELMEDFFVDPDTTIVIGDQLFTDVVMGNWINARTILVDPMDKKLSFFKTVQREIELFLLRRLDQTSVI